MDFFALVPARGGSKGLPGKNLMEVQGISLVARAILLARMVPLFKKVILSTDDEHIMQEGKRAGCTVMLKRPPELARSETPMAGVIEHAVTWIRSTCYGKDSPFAIVMLQPTSPMRRLEHITTAIDLFKEKNESGDPISGVISVSPVPQDCQPREIFRLNGNSFYPKAGKEIIPDPKKSINPFKERLYYRNGAVVILKSDCVSSLNTFIPPMIPYIIEEKLVSIDSLEDLMKAEYCGRALEPKDGTLYRRAN